MPRMIGALRECAVCWVSFSANFNWDFSEQASSYAQVEISGNVEEPLEDYYGWLVLGLKSGLLDSVSYLLSCAMSMIICRMRSVVNEMIYCLISG